MSWIRHTWVIRSIALLLMGSLLPILLAPMVQARHYGSSFSYAGWVHEQLDPVAGDSVDRAIERALASKPASFDAFVTAFVDAYLLESPQSASPAQHPPLHDNLFIYLKSRFLRLIGSAILPGLQFKVTQHRAPVTSLRAGSLNQAFSFNLAPVQIGTVAMGYSRLAPPRPHPHSLSATRPSAP